MVGVTNWRLRRGCMITCGLAGGFEYLGFLFARGESADEVERALRLAHAELRFLIRERCGWSMPVTGRVVG